MENTTALFSTYHRIKQCLAINPRKLTYPTEFIDSLSILYGDVLTPEVYTFERVTSRSRRYGDHRSTFCRLIVPINYTLTDVAGVHTAISPNNTAFWLEQSRGYSRKLVRGFVFKHGARSIHFKSNKPRRLAFKDFAKKMRKAKALEALRAYKGLKWISISDSLSSGNCLAGTYNFISRHNLQGLGAIRSDYLLQLEDSVYTRKAIEQSARIIPA